MREIQKTLLLQCCCFFFFFPISAFLFAQNTYSTIALHDMLLQQIASIRGTPGHFLF